MTNTIRVSEVRWSQHQFDLSSIRREVFIEEQNVPKELEWDGVDPDCRHVLATDTGLNIPVGTGRLVQDGQIGRMAVQKMYRSQGIGCRILVKLIELANIDGHEYIYLNSQLSAVEFYLKAKFEISGKTFMDAGISHVRMNLKL